MAYDRHDVVVEKIRDFALNPIPEVFKRDLSLGRIQPPAIGNLVNVVVGVRRCGKTFRLYQEMWRLMDEGYPRESFLYFNFEDERLKPFSSELLSDVVETFFGMNPQLREEGAFFFFDEIQEVPDWGMFLRRMVDTSKVTMYVTGSSSKMLSAELATEFRGRSLSRELFPMDFFEFARFHYPYIDEDTDSSELEMLRTCAPTGFQRSYLQQALPRYLKAGGFIATQRLGRPDAVQLLQDYANRAVNDDVIERYNISNPVAASQFLAMCLSRSGRELSLNKTAEQIRSRGIKVSRATLADLLGYYEEAFLVFAIQDFSRSLADNPRSPSKLYAVDPALFAAFSPAASQDGGQRLETAVFDQLRRNPGNCRRGSISRLRVNEGAAPQEVDFVVGDALSEAPYRLIQVSVSLDDERTRRREVEALRAAMGKFPQAVPEIVTMGPREAIDTPEGRIDVVPAWEWLLKECIGMQGDR